MNSHDAERHALSRREFLAASGALIIAFSLASSSLRAQQPAAGPKLPGSLDSNPMLDSWIRIDADGSITVFTGKAELGQGVKTALIQIAAEQLYVPPQRIRLITADTRQTPDEGYTAGSNSMKDSGTAIMNAAAQVREILIARASERFGMAADRLKAHHGYGFSLSIPGRERRDRHGCCRGSQPHQGTAARGTHQGA
jgi:CO/xanthine dehydrogenase Mo-binding subunit